MNGRVCFLSRAGDSLAGVRLVGTRSDEAWDARPSDGADALKIQADAGSAAAWIAERAVTGGVGLLCVDVDGSNCRWLSSATADPVLVAAVLDRTDGSGTTGLWTDQNPSMASIQALVSGSTPPKRTKGAKKHPTSLHERRLPVLAVPDTLARLVIDELDDRGIAVQHAASLWHALALAWDPASPVISTVRASGDIVEGAAPVSAVVLADPAGGAGGGRVLWAWSRAGELLAGGVLMASSTGDGAMRLGRADIGRLAADWLGWSMQLGVSPVRIVCVAPPIGQGAEDDMKPAQLGAALGKAWSGAMVDMAVHEDPLGATFSRLASSESALTPNDPRSSLLTLSRRPGRIHRSMYQWIALALAAAGAGLLGIGVHAWQGADRAAIKRDEVTAETRKNVLASAPPPSGDTLMLAMASDNPRSYLDSQIAIKLKKNSTPDTGLPPVRPILAELESLSLVLGTDEIELEEIQVLESMQLASVWVADTKVAEALKDSLDRVANDYCDWTLNFSTGGKTKNGANSMMQLVWLEGHWKKTGGSKP